MCTPGSARSHFRRGDFAAAATALHQTDHFVDVQGSGVDNSCRSEAVWWRARLALAEGDVEQAALHTEKLLAVRNTWWGRWRAGDCEVEIWRKLLPSGDRAGEAIAHRDKAASLYRAVVDDFAKDVADAPEDPFVVVAWGLASVGLAEIESDRGGLEAARTLLDAALPALVRVEAEAHCDLWDEARVASGRTLRERLAGQTRR